MDDNHTITTIDVETTGLNAQYDQIIELSIRQGLDGAAFHKTWRIKPEVPVSAAATAVHGIHEEDLADCRPFSAYAEVFRDIIRRADVIVGYNVAFDLGFLQAEFRRLSLPELDLSEVLVVDPLRIWRKCEPRNLTNAYKRFVGGAFLGAHSAEADTEATTAVLVGMIDSFGLKEKSWKELAELSSSQDRKWIGPTHHICWDRGRAVFGFGKHRNRQVTEVVSDEKSSYCVWLLERDFPEHVKEIARAAAGKSEEDFRCWLTQEFGAECGRGG